MAWPGPAPLPWGLALLLFGVALLPTGELIRRVGARFAGAWAADDPIERVVLDLFLGVGPLYVLGSLPFDLYTAALPAVVMVGGAVALLLLFGGERRGIVRTTPGPRLAFERLAAPGVLAVLGASGLLYVLEVAAAAATPTGNTFDSSILTIFGGLLSAHHVLPTSYVPVAPLGITYPQGTTAVLGAAAAIFHLPAARAPVLVTPLFLALGPLAAYAWGRRWFGSPAHGVAFGLFFALVASWTRVLVAGSNDFVLAFPLVLLLWGAVPRWFAGTLPSWGDVVGFGALAGLSAAFNPVGAQLTFLALPLVAAAMGAAPRHSPGRWAVRLLGALGTALLFVLPSLFELVQGRASSQLVPGALPLPPGTAPGLSLAQVIGQIDPMLFGPTNVWLSPFPVLRAELAVLLVGGVALLLLPIGRPDRRERAFGWFAAAGLLVTSALLLLLSAPVLERWPIGALGAVTSAAELSILLFVLYAGIAALPLAHALEPLLPPERRSLAFAAPAVRSLRARPVRATAPAPSVRAVGVPIVIAAIILVPGLTVTVTALPPYLGDLYGSFGNVTEADFALLSWAADHLPSAPRVLVAPGSAAQFLPGYRPDAALVYPVGPLDRNDSYRTVVAELDRGQLDPAGLAAMGALGVGYVAVTQNNTALWAPFDPAPLLAAPAEFPVLFHEADAYLFAVQLGPPAG